MNPIPRISYSVDELAEAAAVGRTTLYLEIKAGRLRPLKIGKRTIIPVEEARAWMERLRGEAEGGAR